MSRLVLLTGATGFVGRHVLRTLVKRGIRARLVVREGNVDKVDTLFGVESVIVTADLFSESLEWWVKVCSGVDSIIHVAWVTEPGKYLYSNVNLDCLAGTLQMAKAAVMMGVRRFIGIGTCFEYDLNQGRLSVSTALRPTTVYAGAKAAAFISLQHWLPNQGVEFAWCRLFYLYGEGEDARRLVPYLHNKLQAGEPVDLTNGTQIRDFLDVRIAGIEIVDIALGIQQGAINICSGIPITVRQLAEQIASQYGRLDLLRFGARHDNSLDPPCVVGIRTNATTLH
jgi:dTDP-6-deoxy-L-talose 4-dehydrogenase (NAD+)